MHVSLLDLILARERTTYERIRRGALGETAAREAEARLRRLLLQAPHEPFFVLWCLVRAEIDKPDIPAISTVFARR